MKVLIASRYCAPPSYHGSAQHVQLFARELVQNGHEVRVISGEETSGLLDVDGYAFEKIAIKRYPRGLYNILDGRLPDNEFREFARKALDEWRPDVVHIGVFMRMGDFALEAAARNIPVVMMVHDYSFICLQKYLQKSNGDVCEEAEYDKCFDCVKGSLGPKMRLISGLASTVPGLETIMGRGATLNFNLTRAFDEAFSYMETIRGAVDRFVIQTPLASKILAQNGIAQDRCRFVQQFIGDEKLHSYPKPPGRPGLDRPIRAGYVGRWSREKGLKLLAEAFKTQEEGKLELWLIAKDAKEEDVADLFGQGPLRNGNVTLYNDLTGAPLAEAMAQLDLMVIPSICQDNSPRTLLEGLAQRVPAIVSDSVGNRHLIEDRVNGAIFPSGDATALAKIFSQLIESPENVVNWSRQLPSMPNKQQWYDSLFQIHKELVETVE